MLSEKLSLCEDENSAHVSKLSEMSARIVLVESSNMTPIEDPYHKGCKEKA